MVEDSRDEWAPVAYMKLKRFHLEDKEHCNGCLGSPSAEPCIIQVPDDWKSLPQPAGMPCVSGVVPNVVHDDGDDDLLVTCVHTRGSASLCQVSASAVPSSTSGVFADSPMNERAVSCLRKLLISVSDALRDQFGLSLSDGIHTVLCLRDMSLFAAVNAEYVRHFGLNQPPSRFASLSFGDFISDVHTM